MKVPVQNIYYLLCYAFDRIQEGKLIDVASSSFENLQDLFAHVLINGTQHLLRRGLDRSYVCFALDVPGIRGKLDISDTVKRRLHLQAKAHCQFDELSHDVMHNRIIKATLRMLGLVNGLDPTLKDRLAGLYNKLNTVSDISISSRSFRTIQLHRNNGFYHFILGICQLIMNNLIVNQEAGSARFIDFSEDESKMGRLFEKFVFNFLQREQTYFHVQAPQLHWHNAAGSKYDIGLLPIMRTDAVLESSAQQIVIEVKFYGNPMSRYFGKESLNSHHLYQIHSYLYNMIKVTPPEKRVSGMLLYASVGQDMNLDYILDGYPIIVRTIDLNKPWYSIKQEMLSLVNRLRSVPDAV